MKSNIEITKQRSKAKRIISAYLEALGYNEIETPLLSHTAIPESTIELFETRRKQYDRNDFFYLLPSPELYMKKSLAKEGKSIYQFSKCFRNSEQTSDFHSCEFTMLEYYKTDADDMYSLKVTEQMLGVLSSEFNSSHLSSINTVISMRELVKRQTGIDIALLRDKEEFQRAVEKKGVTVWDKSESRADTFNRLFVALVEDRIKDIAPVVTITDYPSEILCLAKDDSTGAFKKRWEMYINGIETANCYTEETRESRVKEYFNHEDRAKKAVDPLFRSDKELPTMALPESSGVAIGFDRLMMCLLDKKNIGEVIPFAEYLK